MVSSDVKAGSMCSKPRHLNTVSNDFSACHPSKRVLWPTQPSIQYVLGTLPCGLRGRGVEITTHLRLVPALRMRVNPAPGFAQARLLNSP